MKRILRTIVLASVATTFMTAHPYAAGPALNWFLWQETLEAPGDGMLALPGDPTFQVAVEVDVAYWVQNDDGSAGQYLGSTSTAAGTQVCYSDADGASEGLGQNVTQGLAQLLGQDVGSKIGRLTTEAARQAAQQANPLNPVHQWGNLYSNAASSGSHFIWRAIGFSAGTL